MKNRSVLFAAPAFILYTALMILPILGAFALSFTSWNGIQLSQMKFVGLSNFIKLFSDKRLGNAICVTLVITFATAVIVNIGGLLLAILLNKAGKLTNLFRSIFFLPYVLSTVAVSFIWMAILSYTGVLNSALNLIGLGAFAGDFIGNAANAIKSICVVEIWRTIGFYMVIYLAALQTVPQELNEACLIDGGGKWHIFRYVTLPHIVPSIAICLMMSIVTEMRQFDIVKVLTNGGPGYATETISYNIIVQAFGNNALGYSSAIAVMLFLVLAIIGVAQQFITRKVQGDSV
ncbi:MAG: sugar ABC transporter permease [Ruthenibacterium sp.]